MKKFNPKTDLDEVEAIQVEEYFSAEFPQLPGWLKEVGTHQLAHVGTRGQVQLTIDTGVTTLNNDDYIVRLVDGTVIGVSKATFEALYAEPEAESESSPT